MRCQLDQVGLIATLIDNLQVDKILKRRIVDNEEELFVSFLNYPPKLSLHFLAKN